MAKVPPLRSSDGSCEAGEISRTVAQIGVHEHSRVALLAAGFHDSSLQRARKPPIGLVLNDVEPRHRSL